MVNRKGQPENEHTSDNYVGHVGHWLNVLRWKTSIIRFYLFPSSVEKNHKRYRNFMSSTNIAQSAIFKGEKASIKNCKVTSISEEFLNQNQCFKAIYLSWNCRVSEMVWKWDSNRDDNTWLIAIFQPVNFKCKVLNSLVPRNKFIISGLVLSNCKNNR